MHICATNICVWIRTLVLESLKEITLYHQGRGPNAEDGAILDSIRSHSLRHAGTVMGTNYGPDAEWEPINLNIRENLNAAGSGGGGGSSNNGNHQDDVESSILSRMVHTTARIATEAATKAASSIASSSSSSTSTSTTTTTTTTPAPPTTIPSTMRYTSTEATTTTTEFASRFMDKLRDSMLPSSTADHPSTTTDDFHDHHAPETTTHRSFADFFAATSTSTVAPPSTSTAESIFNNLFGGMENALQYTGLARNETEERSFESLDSLFPSALIGPSSASLVGGLNSNTSCGRVNIMGTIVQDSAPYLYPFIIEYSLIGAVVIYVMWKHIGRHPK